jgi:hypothetical protein
MHKGVFSSGKDLLYDHTTELSTTCKCQSIYDGWLDGWMDGRMNGVISLGMYVCILVYARQVGVGMSLTLPLGYIC